MINGTNLMAIAPPAGTRGKRPVGVVTIYRPAKRKKITEVININLNTKMKMIGGGTTTCPH
jgi:hypothetical protein